MLLFLLNGHFSERPERAAPRGWGEAEIRTNVQASLVAGAVLTGWCLLRLAMSSQGRSLDSFLAALSLLLGAGAVLRAVRALARRDL